MNNRRISPDVSVIMPTFNSEKYIADAILSVINQSFKNWELLIIDAISTDKTKQIVDKFVRSDNRIKLLINLDDRGPAHARATGIRQADGRFIAFLDADDLWFPSKLEKQLNFMTANSFRFSYTLFNRISETGKDIKTAYSYPWYDYYRSLRTRGIGCLTVMVERDLLTEDIIRLNDKKHGEDYLWWLSIIKKGVDAYGLMEVHAKYRKIEGSLSSQKLSHLKSIWSIYRSELGLSFLQTFFCFLSLMNFKLITDR